jgi:thiosulfate/3-mercaptopyruvate sulfurtransferase
MKYSYAANKKVIKLSFEKGKSSVFLGLRQSMKNQLVPVILAVSILAVALGSAGLAVAGPSCCAVGGSGGWSGADLLDNMGSGDSDNQQAKIASPSAYSEPVKSKQAISTDVDAYKTNGLDGSEGILIQPSQVTKGDVILNIDTKPQSYAMGAIHIDYLEFTDGSDRPKSTSELSRILGNAGISRSDPLVIYSEDLSAATYVYLILDSLGQESIRLLDGGLEGWTAAGKPTEGMPAVLVQKSYLPVLRPDLIASYEYVMGKDVQVVDARSSKEYLVGSIPGSQNIPFDSVLDRGKIKDEAALMDLFAGLRKDKPVAVYSNSGVKASLLWYALELGGYDSRVYAGDNWAENLLKNNGEDGKIQAETAPAPTSSPAPIISSGSSGSKPSCH